MRNKEILFANRPAGVPTADTFKIVETEMPPLQDGEVLVRSLYLSVDPYLRGRMREGKSYVAPFELGDVITSGVVGEIVESRSLALQVGDVVSGMLGWRLFNVAKAIELQKLDQQLAPVSTALGVLGIPGLTAYFGLLDVGQPQAGETVVISGAAGAVGITALQIAKLKGCRVVGIAGTEEKNRYLVEVLGADAAINYKSADWDQQLREACPQGVDIYFDNVGGAISDAVMPLIRRGARVVICGLISLYNLEQADAGPRPQRYLLVNRALMRGFIIIDYAARFAEGVNDLRKWLAAEELKYVETIVEGFDNTPSAFLGLFTGANIGKQIVKVVD